MSNKSIALEVKNQLMHNVEFANVIRSTAKGEFLVFIRSREVQKFRFNAITLDSVNFKDDDYNDEEIELPKIVYRRFCMLLGEMINQMHYQMEYGNLVCSWEFAPDQDGNWKDVFRLKFEKEIVVQRGVNNKSLARY